MIDERITDYLVFLRFCLHQDDNPPSVLSSIDWDKLYTFGKEQAILGVLFHGIERLSNSDYKPSRAQIMKWYGAATVIRNLNKQAYKDASTLTSIFKEKYGVESCVLKGQSNSLLYPNPYIRTSGDIDIWTSAKTINIIKIAREFDPKGEIGYHHIEMFHFKTPVEVHFFPSFMGNLWNEYKLRKFFDKNKSLQWDNHIQLPDNLGRFSSPTNTFNMVFQMSHLMHHFFFEGIGLRQMIDYYYLLLNNITQEEREETLKVFRKVGLYKFSKAVMYILSEVFGLETEYLLVTPNAKLGKLLLSEILLAGNFGFHDKRYAFAGKSVYSQYFVEIYRNLHFAFDFPSEAIWGRPVSRWWHMLYKAYLRNKLKKINIK